MASTGYSPAAVSPVSMMEEAPSITALKISDTSARVGTALWLSLIHIFMAFPGAQILLLDENGIRPTAYEDTEHYQITRAFLQKPQRMLRELMTEDRPVPWKAETGRFPQPDPAEGRCV